MEEASPSRQRWELENDIATLSTHEADALYEWDAEEQRQLQTTKPWTRDPRYFKRVRISALALLKMTMHASSGGNIEVMGLMRGRVTGDTFLVLDAFPLPVEGTETRVNAQSEAYEYMVDFLETCKLAGRPEHVVGWYHSHPGYGCWLSGIDVSTQLTNQMYQEPFLAIVIDPHRTASAGRVEIGAFRTYPEGHKLALDASSEYQTIPMDKIEDFGVHANQYYSLDVSYFKSSMDVQLLNALWDRHWVNTLAASPLLMGQTLLASQIADIAKKIRLAESQTASSKGTSRFMHGSSDIKSGEGKLEQAVKDASTLAREQAHGLSVQVIKEMLFRRPCCCHSRGAAGKPMEV